MTSNDSMFPVFERFLNFRETTTCIVSPDGVMHQDKRPAGIAAFLKCIQHKISLCAGKVVIVVVVAIENNKKYVFVIETVIPFPVSFFPLFFHHFIRNVMVSGQIKEWHFQT